MDISPSRLGVSVSVPFSEISGADGLRVYLLGYQSSSVGFWGPSRSIISFSHGEAILLTQLADTGAPARETGQRQSDRERIEIPANIAVYYLAHAHMYTEFHVAS